MSTKKNVFGIKELERKYGVLSLGRFIASWRQSEGLSQKDFAKKLRMSPANLCDIEKGRKGVSLYKATEIAKVIGYSPTVLVQLALQDQVDSTGLDYCVELRIKAA